MKKYVKIGCVIFAMLAAGIAGAFLLPEPSAYTPALEEVAYEEVLPTSQPEGAHEVWIRDDPSVYRDDDEGSLEYMYLTVRRGNPADNSDHAWSDVNNHSAFYYFNLGIERYRVEAILQTGDENGPAEGGLGYGLRIPNAIVQIRGNTTSRAPQKSYTIYLKPGMGEWRGQTTLSLNKHPYDALRFRNKLCYDLIKGIPSMISMRTQFVHLFVKDETGASDVFVDYGLFTQVEHPNKTYLANHGLDRNGYLYKVRDFAFTRSEDKIKLITDPDYSVRAFEEVLKPKGSDDHSKLIEMLEAVNDYDTPIKETFEKYFDADNYFAWLAFHILTHDTDTINRNHYIYSPLNGEKWYFVSWDNDGSFGIQEMRLLTSGNAPDDELFGFQSGISNYWQSVLHQRVLKEAKYRSMLDEKMHEVKAYLSRERIDELVQTYRAATEEIIYSEPDVLQTTVSRESYNVLANTLAAEIDMAYALYKESLLKPMPFYMGCDRTDAGNIEFTWDIAYTFDEQMITYKLEIAKDIYFTDVVYSQSDIAYPSVEIDMLLPDLYFYRITATDEKGKSQRAMTYFVDENFTVHYGVTCFEVREDKTIMVIESELEGRDVVLNEN